MDKQRKKKGFINYIVFGVIILLNVYFSRTWGIILSRMADSNLLTSRNHIRRRKLKKKVEAFFVEPVDIRVIGSDVDEDGRPNHEYRITKAYPKYE